MLPILQVGPLAIQTPGLILLLGLWFGLSLAERSAPRHGLQASAIYNLVFVALLAGVVGARLTYALRYPEVFAASPIGLVSLNPGLLDPWGGLTAGSVAAAIYAQRKSLPAWRTFDALTPMLAVFSIALSLSHLASGEAFGAPTNLPWGVELWGERRHPTQVYEALAAGLILLVLWPGRGGWRSVQPGILFLSFVALSASARLFLEAFRGDSILLPGGLRLGQVLAWLVLAASLWGLHRLSVTADADPPQHEPYSPR
jgi:prolipoprotein diacylglyceryltransferase